MLIIFWTPLQKVSKERKKALSKPWMTKGILKSTAIKKWHHEKMHCSKDPFKIRELEIKV